MIVFFLDIEAIQETLLSVNTSVNDLQSNTTSINGSLQTIATSVETAFDNCTALDMNPAISIDCSALNPDTFRNGLSANYFEVSTHQLFMVSTMGLLFYNDIHRYLMLDLN